MLALAVTYATGLSDDIGAAILAIVVEGAAVFRSQFQAVL
jgi:hypothetical protein